MDEPVQTTFLQADDTPGLWTCPNCRGNLRALRLLYPDEREEGGPLVAERPCRTCQATGTVTYDPNDFSVYPY